MNSAKAKRLEKAPRGATRAQRRAAGNYKPVNPAASLEQHPEARFAREGGKA
ncbi:hypothetical protein [Acinetobacter sp.]|uniref:hypothetical protein n=1 Tax=Acinetobacter sp. TaxID=472 RepID=UPI00388D927C